VLCVTKYFFDWKYKNPASATFLKRKAEKLSFAHSVEKSAAGENLLVPFTYIEKIEGKYPLTTLSYTILSPIN
jgi:hypothetical protein